MSMKLAGLWNDLRENLTLRSPVNRLADTSRLRIISGQHQEPENSYNGGESIWFDLQSPLAKNMLTWRIRMNNGTRLPLPETDNPLDTDYNRIVWAGAHYYAQDQVDYDNPTDVHGHWSIEVPDTALALRTRFSIDFIDRTTPQRLIGVAVAQIGTNAADFTVTTLNGGSLRMNGPANTARQMEWSTLPNDQRLDNPTGVRWRVGSVTSTESGSNVGSDWQIDRYDDTGTALGTAMFVKRASGRVNFGATGQDNGRVTSTVISDGAHGFYAKTSGIVAGFAAFAAQQGASGDRVFDFRVSTDTVSRMVMDTTGRIDWGSGSATRDTSLYRSAANVLKTDNTFKTGASVTGSRPAAATVGQGAQWFDTTLNLPIWSNGTAWVNAAGTTV